MRRERSLFRFESTAGRKVRTTFGSSARGAVQGFNPSTTSASMDQSSRLCSLGSRVASLTVVVLTLALLTLSAATAHAATEGERCGRFGSWSDSCDEGLECSIRWSFWRWDIGVCTPVDRACGARLGDTCAADEFCSFTPEAICGFADATGVCEPRPEVCTDQYDPVCGCNGETYGNACEANAAGVSIQAAGECPPVSECESDEDCPFGFCDIGVTCAGVGCPPPPPNRCTVCGDGTDLLCRRAVPECPDGLVPEIVNSCFGACVDRVTCEPQITCEYDGVVYRPGDGFPADDGCNECGCQDDGTVVCTLRLCACDYSDPARTWVERDPEVCTRIDFQCPEGEQQFTDACGCGCQR
jgi:hypothetical protein